MKTLVSLLSLTTILCCTNAHASITNLVLSSLAGKRATNAFPIAAGHSAKLISTEPPAGIGNFGWFNISQNIGGTHVGRSLANPITFYGPCTLEYWIYEGNEGNEPGEVVGMITLDIDPSPPISLIPSTAVVIPSDAAGPVTIILESSMDMVTWVATLPGQYATSTTNRFFRVRAVRNP